MATSGEGTFYAWKNSTDTQDNSLNQFKNTRGASVYIDEFSKVYSFGGEDDNATDMDQIAMFNIDNVGHFALDNDILTDSNLTGRVGYGAALFEDERLSGYKHYYSVLVGGKSNSPTVRYPIDSNGVLDTTNVTGKYNGTSSVIAAGSSTSEAYTKAIRYINALIGSKMGSTDETNIKGKFSDNSLGNSITIQSLKNSVNALTLNNSDIKFKVEKEHTQLNDATNRFHRMLWTNIEAKQFVDESISSYPSDNHKTRVHSAIDNLYNTDSLHKSLFEIRRELFTTANGELPGWESMLKNDFNQTVWEDGVMAKKQDDIPSLQNMAVVRHKSAIYVIGGDSDISGTGNIERTIYRSSDGGESWQLHGYLPGSPRENHSATSDGEYIYVSGGNDGTDDLKDLWRSKDGKEWQRPTPNIAAQKSGEFPSSPASGGVVLSAIIKGSGDNMVNHAVVETVRDSGNNRYVFELYSRKSTEDITGGVSDDSHFTWGPWINRGQLIRTEGKRIVNMICNESGTNGRFELITADGGVVSWEEDQNSNKLSVYEKNPLVAFSALDSNDGTGSEQENAARDRARKYAARFTGVLMNNLAYSESTDGVALQNALSQSKREFKLSEVITAAENAKVTQEESANSSLAVEVLKKEKSDLEKLHGYSQNVYATGSDARTEFVRFTNFSEFSSFDLSTSTYTVIGNDSSPATISGSAEYHSFYEILKREITDRSSYLDSFYNMRLALFWADPNLSGSGIITLFNRTMWRKEDSNGVLVDTSYGVVNTLNKHMPGELVNTPRKTIYVGHDSSSDNMIFLTPGPKLDGSEDDHMISFRVDMGHADSHRPLDGYGSNSYNGAYDNTTPLENYEDVNSTVLGPHQKMSLVKNPNDVNVDTVFMVGVNANGDGYLYHNENTATIYTNNNPNYLNWTPTPLPSDLSSDIASSSDVSAGFVDESSGIFYLYANEKLWISHKVTSTIDQNTNLEWGILSLDFPGKRDSSDLPSYSTDPYQYSDGLKQAKVLRRDVTTSDSISLTYLEVVGAGANGTHSYEYFQMIMDHVNATTYFTNNIKTHGIRNHSMVAVEPTGTLLVYGGVYGSTPQYHGHSGTSLMPLANRYKGEMGGWQSLDLYNSDFSVDNTNNDNELQNASVVSLRDAAVMVLGGKNNTLDIDDRVVVHNENGLDLTRPTYTVSKSSENEYSNDTGATFTITFTEKLSRIPQKSDFYIKVGDSFQKDLTVATNASTFTPLVSNFDTSNLSSSHQLVIEINENHLETILSEEDSGDGSLTSLRHYTIYLKSSPVDSSGEKLTDVVGNEFLRENNGIVESGTLGDPYVRPMAPGSYVMKMPVRNSAVRLIETQNTVFNANQRVITQKEALRESGLNEEECAKLFGDNEQLRDHKLSFFRWYIFRSRGEGVNTHATVAVDSETADIVVIRSPTEQADLPDWLRRSVQHGEGIAPNAPSEVNQKDGTRIQIMRGCHTHPTLGSRQTTSIGGFEILRDWILPAGQKGASSRVGLMGSIYEEKGSYDLSSGKGLSNPCPTIHVSFDAGSGRGGRTTVRIASLWCLPLVRNSAEILSVQNTSAFLENSSGALVHNVPSFKHIEIKNAFRTDTPRKVRENNNTNSINKSTLCMGSDGYSKVSTDNGPSNIHETIGVSYIQL